MLVPYSVYPQGQMGMVTYQVCMEVSGRNRSKDPGFLTGQGPSPFLPTVFRTVSCPVEVEWSLSQAAPFPAASLFLNTRLWA